jgi:hypothetical protein
VKHITFKNYAFQGYGLLHWVALFDEIESVEYVTIEGSVMSKNAQNYLQSVTETIRLVFWDCEGL